MKVTKYQDLIAWQKALALVTRIYSATADFPREEMYGLTAQLRRASVSIPSNIAEGRGRATRGEFLQYLCHARGSLYEIETQILIASKLGYIDGQLQNSLIADVSDLGRILNGLISSLESQRKVLRRQSDH